MLFIFAALFHEGKGRNETPLPFSNRTCYFLHKTNNRDHRRNPYTELVSAGIDWRYDRREQRLIQFTVIRNQRFKVNPTTLFARDKKAETALGWVHINGFLSSRIARTNCLRELVIKDTHVAQRIHRI